MESTFQERLGVLLDEYSGNATDLAEKLQVSKQTISAWRSGVRSPKRPVIEHIARFFDVCIPWLMGLDVPREPFYTASVTSATSDAKDFPISDEERLLVIAYRQAPPEYQAVVMDILSRFGKGGS